MASVVFDAVVFVRCLLNPYSRWGRLVFARRSEYRLVTSEPVLRETLEVIQRPEITRKYRFVEGLDLAAVQAILAATEVVKLAVVPAVSRDPKDDLYLATAREARTPILVIEDDDLLVLGEYEGTKIVTAETFLAILDQRRDRDDDVPSP